MIDKLTCKDRVETHKNSRIEDLRKFQESEDYELNDGSNVFEYGLSWDYVEPETFDDQPDGYFRYQISWGGPSEEIRYYVDADDVPRDGYLGDMTRVEFWLLDWFDGACIELVGDDLGIALWIAELHLG
jgi:hypothetical protein